MHAAGVSTADQPRSRPRTPTVLATALILALLISATADTWTSGPPLPKGHSHAEGSTFVHDGRIYMAGGHTTAPGESKQVDPDILVLSAGGEWEVVGTLPMPLSSPAAAIIDGRFYVAGRSPGRSAVQADMWVGRLP